MNIRYVTNGKGCHICTSHSKDGDGYPMIFRKGRRFKLNRFIYLKYHGHIPQGMVVRHTCDNPKCINPNHLKIGTVQDNIADRVIRGRSAKGEKIGAAKLTEEKVRQIRDNKVDSNYKLADYYGVDVRLISRIRRYMIWKHVA